MEYDVRLVFKILGPKITRVVLEVTQPSNDQKNIYNIHYQKSKFARPHVCIIRGTAYPALGNFMLLFNSLGSYFWQSHYIEVAKGDIFLEQKM